MKATRVPCLGKPSHLQRDSQELIHKPRRKWIFWPNSIHSCRTETGKSSILNRGNFRTGLWQSKLRRTGFKNQQKILLSNYELYHKPFNKCTNAVLG